LQSGTLKSDFTDKQCSFLVNLITDNTDSEVSYEQFLDFALPRSRKKLTKRLVNKIKRRPALNKKKCTYAAVCSLAKLFECEVQMMKKI